MNESHILFLFRHRKSLKESMTRMYMNAEEWQTWLLNKGDKGIWGLKSNLLNLHNEIIGQSNEWLEWTVSLDSRDANKHTHA